jgi:hypothetical protein
MHARATERELSGIQNENLGAGQRQSAATENRFMRTNGDVAVD